MGKGYGHECEGLKRAKGGENGLGLKGSGVKGWGKRGSFARVSVDT